MPYFLFKFLYKLGLITKGTCSENSITADTWVVHWKYRYGEYSGDRRYTSKAFCSAADAENFAKALCAAQKLLKYQEDLDIKVEHAE